MNDCDTVVVGAGFGGLSVAHEMALAGRPCIVLESDDEPGGLAGSFSVNGYSLEKFYHHWFTSDTAIFAVIDELGVRGQLTYTSSNTGIYSANRIFRLSRPLDLLRFSAIPFVDRVRTGLLALRSRRVRDWRSLEALTALEWLRSLGGRRAAEVIWEPLLRGKFGDAADLVSAVWIWNKLKLRGGSRGKGGREELAYFRGGFSRFVASWVAFLKEKGIVIRTRTPAQEIVAENGRIRGVVTDSGFIRANNIVVTTPLPIFLKLVPHLEAEYVEQAARIRFLGNVCLIMVLKRSLSDTYWLNITDPAFPFVGVIEHTNLELPSNYGGNHIVYLSKYVATNEDIYAMNEAELFEYSLPHLQRMFPEFDRSWVKGLFSWKTPYAQPIVTRHYQQQIPAARTPLAGLWLSTMAQVYPEDRGTNYAVVYGRRVAREILDSK